MSNTNPVPELRRIAEISFEDLEAEDLELLDLASPSELSFVAEHAYRQEPPNIATMAAVGGICVGRLTRGEYRSRGERNILSSAMGRAFPKVSEVAVVRG
jgi:hypothetical protein